MLLRHGWFLLAILAACGCEDYPRDPEGTLQNIRGGTLRVGVSEAPPWVWQEGQEARGVEADLVRELARELDAEIEWVWGNQDDQLAALAEFQLDLVIGGLTQKTPWGKQVGLTRPLADVRTVIALPPGMDPPSVYDGVTIAVPWGSDFTAKVEKIGATPAAADDWWEVGPPDRPAAVGEWAIAPWGLVNTGVELARERHVMAVPPGENGWLVRLERFLHARRGQIQASLAAAAEGRR